MSENSIYMALGEHLQTLTLPPIIEGIVWAGYPTGAQPENYLYVQMLPNNPVTNSVGGTGGQLRGLWQVDVVLLRAPDKGPYEAREVAEAIRRHYSGQKLYRDGRQIIIPSIPTIAPPLIEGAYITVPVTIEYQSPIYEA
ncbi:phage tail terminator-like protein [Pseudovibrio exalbescens]|uniref:phage tail terminator-like protein n=1 Tax=Pseudovibrio exalbescens TaxID=197461 RepID=UPI0011AF62FB|nr:phage tail terminator-like protein [Pseudovibrio exalbescens]